MQMFPEPFLTSPSIPTSLADRVWFKEFMDARRTLSSSSSSPSSPSSPSSSSSSPSLPSNGVPTPTPIRGVPCSDGAPAQLLNSTSLGACYHRLALRAEISRQEMITEMLCNDASVRIKWAEDEEGVVEVKGGGGDEGAIVTFTVDEKDMPAHGGAANTKATSTHQPSKPQPTQPVVPPPHIAPINTIAERHLQHPLFNVADLHRQFDAFGVWYVYDSVQEEDWDERQEIWDAVQGIVTPEMERNPSSPSIVLLPLQQQHQQQYCYQRDPYHQHGQQTPTSFLSSSSSPVDASSPSSSSHQGGADDFAYATWLLSRLDSILLFRTGHSHYIDDIATIGNAADMNATATSAASSHHLLPHECKLSSLEQGVFDQHMTFFGNEEGVGDEVREGDEATAATDLGQSVLRCNRTILKESFNKRICKAVHDAYESQRDAHRRSLSVIQWEWTYWRTAGAGMDESLAPILRSNPQSIITRCKEVTLLIAACHKQWYFGEEKEEDEGGHYDQHQVGSPMREAMYPSPGPAMPQDELEEIRSSLLTRTVLRGDIGRTRGGISVTARFHLDGCFVSYRME